MTNSSSTGGVLTPESSITPAFGNALDALLQAYVMSLTGLADHNVLPRWQPTVPDPPESDVDWCAVGVTNIISSPSPAIYQLTTEITRYSIHENIEILCSFYGPNSQEIAARFRDGLYIPQNHQQLAAFNAVFFRADKIVTAPELINQEWVQRYDITVHIRRRVVRDYPIYTVLNAPSITTIDG